MPKGRIKELEEHFNDKYNAFIAELESQSRVIKSAIESLKSCSPPNRLCLYDYLRCDFDALNQDISNEITGLKVYLESLSTALKDKAQNPFQAIEQNFDIVTGNVRVISDLNNIIRKHNQETAWPQQVVPAAAGFNRWRLRHNGHN